MKLLLKMKHGLGDNAQFTIVLRHLRHYYPDWEIDMEIGVGKESYFLPYTRKLFRRKQDKIPRRRYDEILDVKYPTPEVCQKEFPSSKPCRFIQKVMRIEPIESFFKGYDITVTDEEHELADTYIKKLPKQPFVLIHYLARTLKHRKSLGHDDAAFICLRLLKMGCTPVILDWKGESPIPNQKHIFNPGIDDPLWRGTHLPTAGTTAALIQRARLYIGIDSGPLHIAGCTKTPSIGVWYKHHPINFFDLCDNVTHLIPYICKKNKYIRGKHKVNARQYFEKNYKHIYYKDLSKELVEAIDKELK